MQIRRARSGRLVRNLLVWPKWELPSFNIHVDSETFVMDLNNISEE